MAVLIVGLHIMRIDVLRDKVSLIVLLTNLGQFLQCLLLLWVGVGEGEAGLVGGGDGELFVYVQKFV